MKIQNLTSQDSEFPKSLRHIAQPPQELFVRGDARLLNDFCLAVVGSRAVTPYGRSVTNQLVTEVAWEGITVISGLALGVDSVAHQAALNAEGKTIAVLPSGIERIYPASHRQLADDIIKQGGAVISEYPGDMPPHKYHFIARNRIIAGLADAVLVTEASTKSGSLHTAQFALDDGKEVMATPGSIFNPHSVGCHRLIAAGALLVQDAQTIINLINKFSRLSVVAQNRHHKTLAKLAKGQTIT
jgi:DNA processing protein